MRPLDAFPSLGHTTNLHRITLLAQIRRLAEEPADYIQLREKHLGAGSLAALARQILQLLDDVHSPTRLLINTRVDVAIATSAQGVHLTSTPGGLEPAQIRSLYHLKGLPPPVVSRSCHSLTELQLILPQAPDLILFSPVFGKSHDGLPITAATGIDALRSACALAHPIPILALGGVTPANLAECLHAGARGVAGIRFFAPK